MLCRFTYLLSKLCMCGLSVSMCVGAINLLVNNGDSQNLLSCLQDEKSQLHDVSPQYIDAYLHHLTQRKSSKPHTGLDEVQNGLLIRTLYRVRW